MTLFPNRPHLVKATFSPMHVKEGHSRPTPGLTAAEIAELQSQLPFVMKWTSVWGMEDGQTYKIGVSDGARVKERNISCGESRDGAGALEGGDWAQSCRRCDIHCEEAE